MFLRLTEKSPFWSLVDEKTRKLLVHLTFQNPGPQEVDYESLAPHHKKIVKQGLALGFIAEVKKEVKPPEPEKEVVETPPPLVGDEDRRVAKQLMTVEELLDQGVRGIRDELREASYNAEFLTRAISAEKDGNNRITVIQALEQKINKLGGAGAVEESDKEEITIQLA